MVSSSGFANDDVSRSERCSPRPATATLTSARAVDHGVVARERAVALGDGSRCSRVPIDASRRPPLPARSRPPPLERHRVRSVPTSGDAASIESGGAPAPAASPPGATDVRVRVLRGETDIPRIVTLCSAVFKEVAVPMPAGADDPVLLDLAEFLESRYEQAMIKDLTSVITRNMREKRRAANQQHAEVGRVRARATARELQALQRTRTSVDALTTEQLCEMRRRITDEIEIAVEQDAKEASAEYVKEGARDSGSSSSRTESYRAGCRRGSSPFRPPRFRSPTRNRARERSSRAPRCRCACRTRRFHLRFRRLDRTDRTSRTWRLRPRRVEAASRRR